MRVLAFGLALLLLQVPAVAAGELTGTLKRISNSGQMNIGFR